MYDWLAQYSRPVLIFLVVSNITVALGFGLRPEPVSTPSAALSPTPAQHALHRETDPADVIAAEVIDAGMTDAEVIAAATAAVAIDSQSVQSLDAEPVEELPRTCRSWGPEPSADVFAPRIATLQDEGAFPEIVESHIAGPEDYLVYIDAMGSADQARRIAGELQAVGIDSYRINRDSGMILSVGVFSRRPLADAQLSRVEKLGYNAGLETLSRTQTVYNLQAYVAADSQHFSESTMACADGWQEFAQGK